MTEYVRRCSTQDGEADTMECGKWMICMDAVRIYFVKFEVLSQGLYFANILTIEYSTNEISRSRERLRERDQVRGSNTL